MLVATRRKKVVGFLRLVVQEIGADEDRPSVTFDGEPLTEAKILAFGVAPACRRQGVGRDGRVGPADRTGHQVGQQRQSDCQHEGQLLGDHDQKGAGT